MSRSHVQPFLCGGIDPATLNALAGENQRVLAVLIDHGEFQIAIEGRIRGRLPHTQTLMIAPDCALI
jgi:hypothetical protein